MATLKTLAIASALVLGASQLAFAQAGNNTGNGSSENNAAMSGGPGSHQGAQKTGSASNSQKVYKNQNGYQSGKQ